MSKIGLIIEGLSNKRLNESMYEDTPVCYKTRELQKVCSDAMEKKYLKILKPYGIDDIGVEIYVHDDNDSLVEDAIYEVTIYMYFDDKVNVDVKAFEKVLKSVMKDYPGFKYDKPTRQFYLTSDTYEDVIDILRTMEKDGFNIGKLYSIKSVSDIEYYIDKKQKEWEEDRRELEWEYRRSR